MIRVRDYFLIIIFFLDPSICQMFLLVALSNGPVLGLNQLSETEEEEDQTVT